MSLSNWKSSWYEFFSIDRRVLSSERLNIDFLDDSDKNRGSMSPNNDGRNVFLWMVFMGFIFVSLVVLERVMEVPQIWLVWSWRWRIWKGGHSGRSTKLDFPLKLTAFWIHDFLPSPKPNFFFGIHKWMMVSTFTFSSSSWPIFLLCWVFWKLFLKSPNWAFFSSSNS